MADGAPAERLGEIIRRQRELSELSMRQFARLAGISNPSAFEQAVREDPRLTGRQRQALL